ncbi:class I SAM-dependent methyltransferase [Lancefieldella rimae]|nr:class I SAM-dependent methyltransferase [Lancefieldella rimae]
MTLPPALDVACGPRSFYFDKQDARVLKCDAHPRHLTLCDGRALDVSPDMVADFRELPFPDESFNLVIFDPPHLIGKRGWRSDYYGSLDSHTWREDLAKGFRECLRVLKPYGVLVFKWCECDIPLKDVLALCPAKPIIGNRRPKASKTHWILFMREPQEQAALPAGDYIDNQILALAT